MPEYADNMEGWRKMAWDYDERIAKLEDALHSVIATDPSTGAAGDYSAAWAECLIIASIALEQDRG
jgi:hypothetical protein